MNKRYIDFYEDNQIIPVRQDLTDLQRHYRRRDALYRQLGILPQWFKNKSILEFGPGTGDNAVHISSKRPAQYVLVDANKYSIKSINEKISKRQIEMQSTEVIHSDMLAYNDDRQFDVVLCEGMLDAQDNSARYLSHAASFVDTEGVLVITTSDYISMLGDVCRRILKPLFVEHFQDSQQLLKKLVEFLEPDFAAMPYMSKLPEDWVLDSVFHPWELDIFFPFPEAIETLSSEFDVYGTSPNFLTDWRWYKMIIDDEPGFNTMALKRYEESRLAFLDFRVSPEEIGPCNSNKIAKLCYEALVLHIDIWDGTCNHRIPDFLEIIGEISNSLGKNMPRTKDSLQDYIVGVRALLEGDMKADFGRFWGFFGRAQQYVSFVRRWD